MLCEIRKSFMNNINPQLTETGTSGTYFLKNTSRVNLAIFKPFDEEPYADNNPKGYTGKLGSPGFRAGIKSGESATREVAAYLLDRTGFHNVPETVFAEIRHQYFNRSSKKKDNTIKYGSLQVFKKHHDMAGNYGSMLFPTQDVHRIAILDIRILNCDRNEENILIKKVSPNNLNKKETSKTKSYDLEMIPIDHGLSFPDKISICSYEIVWMEWPQIQQAFTKEELEFINSIDPEEDVKYLQKHLKFRDICLRNFRMAEILLKKCAKEGLTLYQIGAILYKEDPEELSDMEKIIEQAESMFNFTKKSVDQTIFVMNLIKKTKFMSKNPRKNGILNKSSGLKAYEEKKTAKDDHFMAYGEKDRFQELRFKRQMQRNLSHRGNLNTLDMDAEKTSEIKKIEKFEEIREIQEKQQNHEIRKNLQIQKNREIEEIEEIEENGENKGIREFHIFSSNPKTIFEENEDSSGSESSIEKAVLSSEKKKQKDCCEPLFALKKNSSNFDTKNLKISFHKRNLTVKKVISMPNLNGFSKEKNEKTNENGNGNMKSQQYDEIFFYYFESFLDQFLLKKLRRKRLLSEG